MTNQLPPPPEAAYIRDFASRCNSNWVIEGLLLEELHEFLWKHATVEQRESFREAYLVNDNPKAVHAFIEIFLGDLDYEVGFKRSLGWWRARVGEQSITATTEALALLGAALTALAEKVEAQPPTPTVSAPPATRSDAACALRSNLFTLRDELWSLIRRLDKAEADPEIVASARAALALANACAVHARDL